MRIVTNEFQDKYPDTFEGLISLGGVDEGNPIEVYEVSSEEFDQVGTYCGKIGNNAFSCLKDIVDSVVILINRDHELNENGYIAAISFAVKCSREKAEEVEKRIEECGGSGRLEDNPSEEGFWLFESE